MRPELGICHVLAVSGEQFLGVLSWGGIVFVHFFQLSKRNFYKNKTKLIFSL